MTRAAENHFQTKTAITADKKLLPQALPTLLLHTGMRFFRTSIYFMLILLGALFILLNLNPNECSAETWHRVAASDTITYSIDLDTVETHTSAAGPSTSAWIKYEYADRSFLIEYVQATPAQANTLTTQTFQTLFGHHADIQIASDFVAVSISSRSGVVRTRRTTIESHDIYLEE